MTTHYDTLGVEPTASPDEIKRAYRKRARETHPDHGGDTAEAAQVNGAYLDHERQQGMTATASLRQAVKRTGKILRRLKFKGSGQNFMARQLEEAIRRQEADIAGNENRLAIIARARLILDDYDYQMDAPPMAANPFASSSAGGFTMGWDLGRPTY